MIVRAAAALCGLVLCLSGAPALAEPLRVVSEAPLVERDAYQETIRSRITGREYRVQVWLPFDGQANEAAPVLYVMDGGGDGGTAAAVTRLQGQAYVVAVSPADDPGGPSFQRHGADYLRRELLHYGLEIPAQGGSPAYSWAAGDGAGFQRFLLEELKPLIEQRHPGAGASALIGEGMAGTFVLHVAADKPDAFKLYGAADPSIDAAMSERLSRPGPKAAAQSWSVKLLLSWRTADHMWTDPERPIGEAFMARGYQARWKNNLGWADLVAEAFTQLGR